MKIQFHGTSAVLSPGTDDVVEPGDVIEVADDVGESLLLAGHAFDTDGTVTAPKSPLWTRSTAKKATTVAPVNDPAAPGKEG